MADDEQVTPLQLEVGERLRDRRVEVGRSLRDVAVAAGVSASHLSEIENGRAIASLPVLLRVCRVLDYPLVEMLPRLEGHRVRQSTVDGAESVLSHGELGLHIERHLLVADDTVTIAPDEPSDLFCFVFSGQCRMTVDGVEYELGEYDSVDVERLQSVDLTGSPEAVVVSVLAVRE